MLGWAGAGSPAAVAVQLLSAYAMAVWSRGSQPLWDVNPLSTEESLASLSFALNLAIL